jgi:hypothetical protein
MSVVCKRRHHEDREAQGHGNAAHREAVATLDPATGGRDVGTDSGTARPTRKSQKL